jgi:hypothetical protein
MTTGKDLQNPWTQKGNLQQAFSLPWSACKRIRRKESKTWGIFFMAKIKIWI